MMEPSFSGPELVLIAHALASFQHNSAFRAIRAKVDALVAEDQPYKPKIVPTPKIRRP